MLVLKIEENLWGHLRSDASGAPRRRRVLSLFPGFDGEVMRAGGSRARSGSLPISDERTQRSEAAMQIRMAAAGPTPARRHRGRARSGPGPRQPSIG